MYNDYVRYKMIYEYYRVGDISYNVVLTDEFNIGIKNPETLNDSFEKLKNDIWDHAIPHYVGKSEKRRWVDDSINFHLTKLPTQPLTDHCYLQL